jgi:hypothetical protein
LGAGSLSNYLSLRGLVGYFFQVGLVALDDETGTRGFLLFNFSFGHESFDIWERVLWGLLTHHINGFSSGAPIDHFWPCRLGAGLLHQIQRFHAWKLDLRNRSVRLLTS